MEIEILIDLVKQCQKKKWGSLKYNAFYGMKIIDGHYIQMIKYNKKLLAKVYIKREQIHKWLLSDVVNYAWQQGRNSTKMENSIFIADFFVKNMWYWRVDSAYYGRERYKSSID